MNLTRLFLMLPRFRQVAILLIGLSLAAICAYCVYAFSTYPDPQYVQVVIPAAPERVDWKKLNEGGSGFGTVVLAALTGFGAVVCALLLYDVKD